MFSPGTSNCAHFRQTSAERGVYLPSERARLDLRTLHRQPDQEGPLGVLALVDGGTEGRQPPLGMTKGVRSMDALGGSEGRLQRLQQQQKQF